MANLTIVFFPEPGHLTPIGDVVRALLRRGHRATFMTVPDAVQLAEPYACPVAIVGEDELPLGSRVAAHVRPTRRERRRRYQIIDRFLLKVAQGAYDGVIRRTEPDVLLADSILGLFTLRARALGVPAGTYCTSLPDDVARGVPRLDSDLLPPPPWRDVARDRIGRCARTLKEHARGWLAGRRVNRRNLMASTARRVGYPAGQLDRRGWHGHMLRATPELILCSAAFDFPRPSRANRLYLGPCIDLGRPESGTVPTVNPDRPLVYVSLGTQTHRHEAMALRIHGCVVKAAARLPAVDFLAAVKTSAERALPATANVTFVERAAQIAALQRASLFVTHGGLGSVKEALVCGVPMIVVPCLGDQHGNAARVVYHGLGTRLLERELSVDRIEAAIRLGLADDRGRARVRAMCDRMTPPLEEACAQLERTFGLVPDHASSPFPFTYEEVRQ